MNIELAMENNIDIFRETLSRLSVFGYKSSIEEVYERSAVSTALLDELKNDIGNDLFYVLSNEDKQFILDTEGSIDFGYKFDENDLKRIFSSIKNDYQH